MKAIKMDPEKCIRQLESDDVTLDKTPPTDTTNAPAANSPQGQEK